MNIAVLLSGGVDSSVATHLLCEAGYKPDLYYIKIGMDDDKDLTCTAEEDLEIASTIAKHYGLKLNTIDLQKEYWENVIGYTIDRVKKGLTPNPDVMCNKLIKFGCFEDRIGKNYDKTATGHYAQIINEDDKIWLGTGIDPIKDQSDFLAQLNKKQIEKLMLPIGHLLKKEVREIAKEAHLLSAKRKDSQGICFLGKISYNDLIKKYLGEKKGQIIELETGNILGTHKGYWFHTIGQRKGLYLSGGPWFVVKKDIKRNLVYVSHGYNTVKQYSDNFTLKDFHFITNNPWKESDTEIPIRFKIRHTEYYKEGTLFRKNNIFQIKSPELIQGVAPGQFGVIYNDKAKICIGSGEIDKIIK